MVCIYCGNKTQVVNSRHQKQVNRVWRRRQCLTCRAIFTTLESVDTTQAFSVARQNHLEPFSRDKLLLSIHDSLRHRKTAASDASALTNTILSRLQDQLGEVVVTTEQIASVAHGVLSNFDAAAASHYQAFHTS